MNVGMHPAQVYYCSPQKEKQQLCQRPMLKCYTDYKDSIYTSLKTISVMEKFILLNVVHTAVLWGFRQESLPALTGDTGDWTWNLLHSRQALTLNCSGHHGVEVSFRVFTQPPSPGTPPVSSKCIGNVYQLIIFCEHIQAILVWLKWIWSAAAVFLVV